MVWLILLAIVVCFGFSGLFRVFGAMLLCCIAGVAALVALLMVAA